MPLHESSPDTKHQKKRREHQRKSTPNLHFAILPIFCDHILLPISVLITSEPPKSALPCSCNAMFPQPPS